MDDLLRDFHFQMNLTKLGSILDELGSICDEFEVNWDKFEMNLTKYMLLVYCILSSMAACDTN